MKKTDRAEQVRKWIRTGAVGVVFLAAVLCFGMQNRREKQTVVLEQLEESRGAAEIRPEKKDAAGNLPEHSADSQEKLRGAQGAQTDVSGELTRPEDEAGGLRQESGGGQPEEESEAPKNASGMPSQGRDGKNACLYVYVCGAVVAPGVYELPAGSRIYAAVEKAGGMTPEAAQEYINLAQEIEDGEQLWIPSREEVKTYQEAGKEVPAVPGAASGSRTGGAAASQKAGTGAAEPKVNLNTASKEELMTLSGIGAARAEAILSYREQKGAFRAIEDIMKVPGIKDAAFQKIKDKIIV